MSQVTRCPSCGTRFKVVADQLRISQGWVRCGMCQSVFDASQDLQSVPDELLQPEAADVSQKPPEQEMQPAQAGQRAPAWPQQDAADSALPASAFDAQKAEALLDSGSDSVDAAPAVAQAAEAAPAAQTADAVSEPELSGSMPGMADAQPSFVDQARPLAEEDAAAVRQDTHPDARESEGGLESSDVPAPAEPALESELLASPPPSEALTPEAAQDLEDEARVEAASKEALLHADIGDIQPARDRAQAVTDTDQDEAAALAGDEPGFVRQARRQAFWHSAGMRVALVLGSLAAVAGVVGQHAWQQRDVLAAQYPALAPVLTKACSLAGCELQARRAIADVVISGSGFKQLADAHQYQWSLTLENRSDVPVAMPMAELTLTDAQDRPLLRRVIDLKPLGAPQQLQARQEWSVNVPVQVQDLGAAVAGYRALVFYP
ncbi:MULTISPECIES: DUF3426 domain-containing protein [Comamonas]|uniref:Zinc finger/thioredoxin putative domain-containing protein n=1 Tax=Comamonas testosteroni TaxID=285 RepID=A0A096F8Y9_COMTE|nr:MULTISPECIES: DUF3426 domain-containing protein [Comamonas]KGH26424.1 hypothetical protein P353_19860 [Comamonas testosteroni]MPT09927.1 DUF3426 domain-containing protein [Comamonas sp.]